MDMTKKSIRRNVGQASRFYIGYQLMMLAGSIIGAAIVAVPLLQKYEELPDEQFEALVNQQAGMISLVALAAAACFVLVSRRKKLWQEDLVTKQTPPLAVMGICVLLTLVAQAVYLGVGPLVECSANFFGYTMAPYLADIANTEETPSMLLYACLLGPIMEEVLFRGVLLRKLRPCGKTYSILITAILFGFFHGELTQGLFAFFVGLILGYLTTVYGIKWAILLHIFNNLVLSTILGAALDLLPQSANDLLTYLLTFGGGAWGLWLLWQHRRKVREALWETNLPPYRYQATFTSVWFLLAILWGVVSCLLIFTKR